MSINRLVTAGDSSHGYPPSAREDVDNREMRHHLSHLHLNSVQRRGPEFSAAAATGRPFSSRRQPKRPASTRMSPY
jgi:hypothetical protein